MSKKWQFTKEEVEAIAEAIEYDLLSKPKTAFSLEGNWNKQFPSEPGIYAVFEKKKFMYIGETSDIRERMKDVRRTYNHTFRRKLGKIRLNAELAGNLFSKETEFALDRYMVEHLEFTCHALTFGRKEVEAYIADKRNGQLLNSESFRGKKKK